MGTNDVTAPNAATITTIANIVIFISTFLLVKKYKSLVTLFYNIRIFSKILIIGHLFYHRFLVSFWQKFGELENLNSGVEVDKTNRLNLGV